MLDQPQIQEFKAAFNMIDQDHDGCISNQDLQDMFASLGKEVNAELIEKMMKEAAGSLNFTMFLTLFGEKMTGMDPENVIKGAFQCFDENNTGTIPEERFREIMTTMGDQFTEDQMDELSRDLQIKDGQFDYVEFARMLKHGTQEK
ncbi:hypothetical protein M3Y97_00481200 [Aphelenchoides bicaudatus]|nr:hypothetical protein M3Y97_00481200 [Aphelenchoides bicaudatus]